MQYSNGLPDWFTAAFANAGDKNTIPTTTTETGAAALNTGWPSICSLPEEAGGIAITREDLNGILYWLSHSIQRLQAGGFMPYNATFASAIGGYPKGAFVRKANGTGYWMNQADSNTTDPDGESAANWADAGIAAGNAVLLDGNQTVAGIKTFTSSPVVPAATAAQQAAAYGQLIGIGQSWQDMTASRSLSTTYTNTTGRTIAVSIIRYGSDAGITLTINGSEISASDTGSSTNGLTVYGLVPPGSTYRASASGGSSYKWNELR